MRHWIIGIAAFALAGCGGSDVPAGDDAASGEAAAGQAMVSEELVALRGDGLSVGGESFYFAAGQTEVEAALTKLLGEATQTGEMAECGAGPMVQTSFSGGLTVNFQDGGLVGWFSDEEAANISATQNIAVGTPRATVENAPGFAAVEGSTLGEEFSYGKGLGGFFEAGAVSALYAGTQCFFR